MSGKNYVIIGASSDVALEYIKHINEITVGDKANIVAHYHSNRAGLDQLMEECVNINLIPVKADLSQDADIATLTNSIEEACQVVDYYLHFPASPFEYMRYKELDIDKIRTELNVQLFSFLGITKTLFPKMAKNEGSRALVMLTKYVDDEIPPKFMTDYVVTKYALLGAMKAAAAECGGKKFMINALSPIMMETKFLRNMDPHIIELNKAKSSLGRIIAPNELIPYIDKLLSDDCSVNGTNMALDEGDFN